MKGLLFRDGEPCPCCGKPLDLRAGGAIKATQALARELANHDRDTLIDLVMLAIDSLYIAASRTGMPSRAYLAAYVDVLLQLARLRETEGPDALGLMVDDELRAAGYKAVPFAERRAEFQPN